jgi:hypothetical protein
MNVQWAWGTHGAPPCVGQETAAVGESVRRVQSDRLPYPVDVSFCDSVLSQHRGSQVGSLYFEASVSSGVLAESQIVHHGRGEEQLLVVSSVVQAALVFGEQAREQEGSDAVVHDRPALGRPDQRDARIDERSRREREDVGHGPKRSSVART